MFICYDLRFPEVFRRVAKDVQAIFIIANWPSERKEHWRTLLKARAIENQCFVIGVNRTGKDGNGISYPGSSAIFGPLGNEMCCGSDNIECIPARLILKKLVKYAQNFHFFRICVVDATLSLPLY